MAYMTVEQKVLLGKKTIESIDVKETDKFFIDNDGKRFKKIKGKDWIAERFCEGESGQSWMAYLYKADHPKLLAIIAKQAGEKNNV